MSGVRCLSCLPCRDVWFVLCFFPEYCHGYIANIVVSMIVFASSVIYALQYSS